MGKAVKSILALTLVALVSHSASAYDFEIAGIYYNIIDSTEKTVEVIYKDDTFNSYSGTVDIPAEVTYSGDSYSVISIGAAAFNASSGLTGVIIPNTVTEIKRSAFFNCSNLTSIKLPALIPSIEEYTFFNCSSLTNITLPDAITSIDEGAFNGCNSLTSVTLPASVTSIDINAYYGCNSLERVNISDLEAWCKISFGSSESNPLYYAHHLYLNGVELTELAIPDNITEIGNWAFYNCSSLTNITLPDSVTSIGESAFFGCSSITSLTIPASVTTIGQGALYCASMTSIYCHAEIPPTINARTFYTDQYTLVTLHVPEGCAENYRTAEYWQNFTDIVDDLPAGVEDALGYAVEGDRSNAEYYDLQGVRVTTPQQGLYIQRMAGLTRKVVIKK